LNQKDRSGEQAEQSKEKIFFSYFKDNISGVRLEVKMPVIAKLVKKNTEVRRQQTVSCLEIG
jgi:hypothetical protein